MTKILDPIDAAGTRRRIDGGWELGFERRLRHPPKRLWQVLTTPEGLACWLAEAVIEPVPGGRMDLHFRQPATDDFPDIPELRHHSNEVLVHRPFNRFEHTFSNADTIVSWRLRPDGEGPHLTLIHRVPEAWECDHSRILAGWHHHMEGLDDAARGARHLWSWPRWNALRDAYEAGMAASP